MSQATNIAVLGSTGSVGKSTLDVVRSIDGLNVFGISGHSSVDALIAQAGEFDPDVVVVTNPQAAESASLPADGRSSWQVGTDALNALASHDQVDTVVAAIVGVAGLSSTFAAVESGKRVALANKETLVVAGQLFVNLAGESGSEILPVDSEHSAVFQAIKSGKEKEVQKVYLTASGGPFRDWTTDQMSAVTVEQALAHPTWSMGPKITIDSATMMNKALEIIEARWLFDLEPEKIGVVIHPQSIVHSLVEFVDGSVLAQMSPPDMKLPIQYALTYPDRVDGPSPKLDLTQAMQLELLPPDFDRFPALKLGFEVAGSGGTAGAVLNAANEAAVQAFLNNEISFPDIVTANREILGQHNFEPNPTLEQLFEADRWARLEMSKWIAA